MPAWRVADAAEEGVGPLLQVQAQRRAPVRDDPRLLLDALALDLDVVRHGGRAVGKWIVTLPGFARRLVLLYLRAELGPAVRLSVVAFVAAVLAAPSPPA